MPASPTLVFAARADPACDGTRRESYFVRGQRILVSVSSIPAKSTGKTKNKPLTGFPSPPR